MSTAFFRRNGFTEAATADVNSNKGFSSIFQNNKQQKDAPKIEETQKIDSSEQANTTPSPRP